jgi:hypothetical protein
LLVDELRQADEGVWQRGLDERYLSVRRRYAPRTPRRYGQLTDLLGSGETIEALRGRLERWLADGLDFGALSAEIEAAFVQTRNPVYVA